MDKSPQRFKTNSKNHAEISSYIREYKLFKEFGDITGIKANSKKVFLVFFVVVRYFGMEKLIEERPSSVNELEHLRVLITQENNIIVDLLRALDLENILSQNPIQSMNEVYAYVKEFIDSITITGEYVCNYPFIGWLRSMKSEAHMNMILENIDTIYNLLQMFNLESTDALLLTLDIHTAKLADDFIRIYLTSNVDKVHVISYSNQFFGKETYKRIISDERYKEFALDRLFYDDCPLASFGYLTSIIDNIEENSFVIIVGIDKLLSPTFSNAVGTTQFQNGTLTLHTPHSFQWDNFVKELDKLYVLASERKVMLTILYTIDDATNPVDLISKAANRFDSFNIINTASDEFPPITRVMKAIEEYGKNNINEQEFEQIINQNREELGEDNYHFTLGVKCLQNNDYITAIDYFQLCSEALPSGNKLIICNLYINLKQYDKAYPLLKEIYESDKYTNNLMPALLETVIHLDKGTLFEEWLSKALDIKPEDTQIIQYAANFYTNNNRYKESADKWNELYRLTDKIEFKLLYEINIMLDNLKYFNESNIVKILMPYTVTYPEMKNEVLFRLGKLFYDDKKNVKRGLPYFAQIDRNINTPNAYVAAIHRIEIFKDKISEANTNRSNEIQLAGKQRDYINELISDVGILTYTDQGNFGWSKHIEDSFHYDVWKKHLLHIVPEKIEQWSKIDVSFFSKTNLVMNLDGNYFDNFVQVGEQSYLTHVRIRDQLVLLYYAAMFNLNQGKFQAANDTVFTIFRLANIASLEEDKYLAVVLGLLAWSSSNSAMGEEVESTLAAIAAIELAIQCEESVAFFYGFQLVMDFLYNNSHSLQLEKAHIAALNTLVKYLGDRIIEQKKEFIESNYGNIIEQSRFTKLSSLWKKGSNIELLINENEQPKEFADELKILIDTYSKKGMLQQACEYIIRLKDSVKINLSENYITFTFKLYHDWANKLLLHKNYEYALELVVEAMVIINEIRTVNYKRERSLLGKQAHSIYRLYLEIIGRYTADLNDGRTRINTPLIRDVLLNIAPRSIIEQKHFNINESYSDENADFFKKAIDEYYELFHVLNIMQQQGKADMEYSNLIDQFIKQKKYLEVHHPGFKPLPYYSFMTKELSEDQYNAIRTKLNDDEIIFQIVVVKNLLISNVIIKEDNEINVEIIDIGRYKEEFEVVKQHIGFSDSQLLQNECSESFIQLCESISSILIKPLYRFLAQNKYKKLYFMPDLNLTYLNMNYMRYKNQWLINHFDIIENIFDFNIVGSDNKKDYGDKVLTHFVNKQDSSISKIVSMIKKQPQVEMIESKDGFVEISQDIKSFVLVGHGISEVNGFNYIGAKEIRKSKKQNIQLTYYLQVSGNIQNAIIISCSSGTLTNDYAELNNGVWSSMLEKNIAYILYCKWDVSIEYTNKLLGLMLQFMNENDQNSLSAVLIKAQRQFSDFHPILWAGLEVWKNE